MGAGEQADAVVDDDGSADHLLVWQGFTDEEDVHRASFFTFVQLNHYNIGCCLKRSGI